MQFIVTPHNQPIPKTYDTDTCYLKMDSWDDFGFCTSFSLYYIEENGEAKNIGPVKIMSLGQKEGPLTELPDSPFASLDKNYCSLGQQQSYYEELMDLPARTRKEILKALCDCAYDEKVYAVFKDEKAMQTSLLRSLSIEKIESSFRPILKGHVIPSSFNFSFSLNKSSQGAIDIKVTPYSLPPTNVHVLIGRNGVGKTRLLSSIADQLTGYQRAGSFSLDGTVKFLKEASSPWGSAQESERFSNLVIVAFSAFDGLEPISKNNKAGLRYDYVGLKKINTPDHFKNVEDLTEEFRSSLEICLSGLRKDRWVEMIKILNADPIFLEYNFEEVLNEDDPIVKIVRIFKKLSSGHRIILLTMTRLVELVEEKTFVLIDEPENHLHPPLLASFTRALSDLLIKRNGVVLIATHSPVVLQEVPVSCVTIMHKIRSAYSFYRPEIETFGENLGTLTREVFEFEVMESGFYKIIRDRLQSSSYKKLLKEFKDQIGSEGRTLARTIIATEDE